MVLPLHPLCTTSKTLAPTTTTLSSALQITIPKAVREQQHWKAGQEFALLPKGKGVLMMPVPGFNALAGLADGADLGDYRDRKDRY